MPGIPEQQEKQPAKPKLSRKTALQLEKLRADVIKGQLEKIRPGKETASLHLLAKEKAYIDFKENRFACAIDKEGKISSINFRGHDVFFEQKPSFDNFAVIADNLLAAWKEIEKPPFYFKPAERESFTSPDGFNFFAQDYCISPNGVIKAKSHSTEQDGQINTVIIYGKNEKPLNGYEWKGETGNRGRFFVAGASGRRVYNFEEAKKNDADLTPKEYLKMAAADLDTPEKLAAFFDTLMRYEYDSLNTKDWVKDYWQLPEETVLRIENGRMLGDCDDYAILAQRILKLQGKHALALIFSPPAHAECFWVEREAGGYIGYSLGTYGLDKQKAPTLDRVLNALLEKWRKEGKMYAVQNGKIDVIDIDSPGQRQVVKMPIGALEDRWMYEGLRTTINPDATAEAEEEEALFIVRNYREGASNSREVLQLCEKMAERKSDNVQFYKTLFDILFENKSFEAAEKKFALINRGSGYTKRVEDAVILECANQLSLTADSHMMFGDIVFFAIFDGDFPQKVKDRAWIDYARWLSKVGLSGRALVFLQQAVNEGKILNVNEAKAEIKKLKNMI
ncbi:hypothetical protein HZC21_04370 [Candidatus Peregrinibacteria bacterium]|nr:hypothetical protein [Candidatus Peregrinibacteria bacterium]